MNVAGYVLRRCPEWYRLNSQRAEAWILGNVKAVKTINLALATHEASCPVCNPAGFSIQLWEGKKVQVLEDIDRAPKHKASL